MKAGVRHLGQARRPGLPSSPAPLLHFSILVLIQFGVVWGSILFPFLIKFWSQIGLGHSSSSKTPMFTKTIKNNEKSTCLTSRRLRTYHFLLFLVSMNSLFVHPFWYRFWIALGSIFCPNLDPKIAQKRTKHDAKMHPISYTAFGLILGPILRQTSPSANPQNI